MRLAVIFLWLVGASAAAAEPYDGVIFAGGSASDDISGYAGAIIALPGAQLGKGFAVKIAGAGGKFNYDAAPGRIGARYYGGAVSGVHQWSGAWGWANASAGARLTQLDVSPDDPGNRRTGARIDAALGFDGGAYLNDDWRAVWYTEGGVRDRAYLGRLELTRRIGASQWRVGVEGAAQGDSSYDKQRAGAVLIAPLAKTVQAQFSVGGEFQENETRPYGAISFVKLF